MGKIATQVQEIQKVQNRINPRQNSQRHILNKLTKIKHKEQILKARKHTHTHTHTHTNKLNDTENRLANWWLTEAEGYGISEDGQREELPVIIPRDIRYSVVTIVNNTVLHI